MYELSFFFPMTIFLFVSLKDLLFFSVQLESGRWQGTVYQERNVHFSSFFRTPILTPSLTHFSAINQQYHIHSKCQKKNFKELISY